VRQLGGPRYVVLTCVSLTGDAGREAALAVSRRRHE